MENDSFDFVFIEVFSYFFLNRCKRVASESVLLWVSVPYLVVLALA